MRVVGDTLYLAYRTGDPDAIKNDASDARFLFKSGGAFDLQIRPDNLSAGSRQLLPQDRRLLIADVRGKMTAVLYHPEKASTPDDRKIVFESPIGRVLFDQVEDVSARVKVAGADGDFEVAVPLALLGLEGTPNIGQEARADIGLIRGDGSRNIQRLCWHNRDTLLVSDIPSEARFEPINWGLFRFVADEDFDDGGLVLGAEKARRNGSGFLHKRLSGDDFVIGFWNSSADFLEWKDQPVKPGRYDVELLYGCGNAKPNAFVFECGGQTLRGTAANTGGWDQYATLRLGVLDLREPSASFALRAVTADGGLMDFKTLRLIPQGK